MNHQCECKTCGRKIKAVTKKDLSVPRYDDIDRAVAINLLELVRLNFPFIKAEATEKDFIEINKLHRIDGRDYKTIRAVMQWSQQDAFWSRNIRSAAKLRKQFDTLLIGAHADYKNQTSKVVSV